MAAVQATYKAAKDCRSESNCRGMPPTPAGITWCTSCSGFRRCIQCFRLEFGPEKSDIYSSKKIIVNILPICQSRFKRVIVEQNRVTHDENTLRISYLGKGWSRLEKVALQPALATRRQLIESKKKQAWPLKRQVFGYIRVKFLLP